VKVSFHSGRAKIIIMAENGNKRETGNGYRTFEIYKMSIACENGSFSFPRDRAKTFEFFFLSILSEMTFLTRLYRSRKFTVRLFIRRE